VNIADAGVQESLLGDQRELGNNLAERRVRSVALRSMAFKLKDRVRRIGQPEMCTVEDIRDPDDHILRPESRLRNYVLDTTSQRFCYVCLGKGK